jgi:hypothetical protein
MSRVEEVDSLRREADAVSKHLAEIEARIQSLEGEQE